MIIIFVSLVFHIFLGGCWGRGEGGCGGVIIRHIFYHKANGLKSSSEIGKMVT